MKLPRGARRQVSQFPTTNLIGPPCPLSNLRPMYYTPLFPTLSQSSHFDMSTNGAPHPYSTSEFPTSAKQDKSDKIRKIQQRLHTKDLEYRLALYRFDAFNQSFWERMNSTFLRSREQYILQHSIKTGESSEDLDLAPFYKAHLERTKKEYAEYNKQLWIGQGRLLWPSIKANFRPLYWRFVLWRAGL